MLSSSLSPDNYKQVNKFEVLTFFYSWPRSFESLVCMAHEMTRYKTLKLITNEKHVLMIQIPGIPATFVKFQDNRKSNARGMSPGSGERGLWYDSA